MSTSVCIVLNEREERKARMAEELERALVNKGMLAFRVPVTEHLSETISKSEAQILVVDYLLGDYTTGLDVIEELKSLKPELKSYFFTDEPSQRVAILAFRSGAQNYYALGDPEEFARLVEEITATHLLLSTSTAPRKPAPNIKLVWNSEESQKHLEELRRVANSPKNLTLLIAEEGSGRKTAASIIAEECGSGALIKLDPLDLSLGSHSGLSRADLSSLFRSTDSTLYIHGLSFFDTTLLRELRELQDNPCNAKLVISCEDRKLCDFFDRNKLDEVKVPNLAERGREDLRAISLAFLKSLAKQIKVSEPQLSASTLALLESYDWKRNISQLKEVIGDALCRYRLNKSDFEGSLSEAFEFSLLSEAKNESAKIEDFDLVRHFLYFNRDLRLTAAHLGTDLEPTFEKLINLIGEQNDRT